MEPLVRFRTLIAVLLLSLAPSVPGSAERPPANSEHEHVVIYMLLGHWRRLGDDRLAVKAHSGSWRPFPPDGKSIKAHPFSTCDGQHVVAVRHPRARLEEITRLIAEAIPPHAWAIEDSRFLPPYIHSWGCNKF